MANDYKRLASIAPSDTIEHVFYTTSPGTSAIINNITVVNTGSSEESFDINVYNSNISEGTVSASSSVPLPYIAADLWQPTAEYYYSTSGSSSWTTGTLPVFALWNKSTYGEGKLLLLSTTGNIAYSEDAINWSMVSLSAATWSGIAYGNGKFVAVSNNSAIEGAYSEDGITWTAIAMPSSSKPWVDINYGNGIFVAIAYDGTTAASTDGINWTQGSMSISNVSLLEHGGDVFLAISEDTGTAAATSADGINWTSRTLPESQTWTSIAYGDGKFVVMAQSNKANPSTIAYTSKGISWGTSTDIPYDYSDAWGVTYGNGKFVAATSTSTLGATSTNGINWTQSTLPANTGFVEYGETLEYYSSPDINSLYKNAIIGASVSEILEPGIVLDENNTLVIKGSSNIGVSLFGAELEESNKYKILGQLATAINTTESVYTVTSGKQSIVKSITLSNTGNDYETISNISIVDSSSDTPGRKDYILYDQEIASGETIYIKAGYTLDSGNTIKIKTSGNITINIFGVELE